MMVGPLPPINLGRDRDGNKKVVEGSYFYKRTLRQSTDRFQQ